MVLKSALCALFAFCVCTVAAFDLSNANWIWSDTNQNVAPFDKRSFRRNFTSSGGRVAVNSEILIAADNNYTLWVNGNVIGKTYNLVDSVHFQKYCVPLDPNFNVFAVSAENLAYGNDPTQSIRNPAAFISAIIVTYSDGTKDYIATDTKWRAHTDVPGFQSVTYDDSTWPQAVILATSNGWYYQPTGPVTVTSSSLTINNSYWIWTNEVKPGNPPSYAPVGRRAFRKTIDVPVGYVVSSGTIIIGADDGYTLYINGNKIGSAATWNTAQRWNFTLNPVTDDIVIAVDAYNTIREAGVIAAVALTAAYCDCQTTFFYTSDDTWKFNPTVPAGFEKPGYDDAGWRSAIEEGPYGIAPWFNEGVVNG